ncbi:DNA-binding protein, partial [Salmonella enterica subsp. enterica serovar Carrau]|nr:DNA-binding protein [Salmonella enterica subsp. enterica serovar Carrau]
RTRNVICTECRNSVTMQRVLAFYRGCGGYPREVK